MKRLGVYLGPAENVGEAMCGVVLNERGIEENRTSIFPLSTEDLNSEPIKKQLEVFDRVLRIKLDEKAEQMKNGKDAADILEAYENEMRSSPLIEKFPELSLIHI